MISKILQWYEFINKIKIWRKRRVIGLAICVIAVVVIPIAWGLDKTPLTPLTLPLPMDYAMSWVILALISMVTLAYVEFINRLRDFFIRKKGDLKTRDDRFWSAAAWQKILLSWTGLVLFITIFTLTFRIVLLSFYPEAARVVRLVAEGELPELIVVSPAIQGVICTVIWIDYFIISSFVMGFIMRFWLYLEAHRKDFWHYTKEYYYGRV